MAFFGSPTNSSFGNPNDLVAQARRVGMSDDEIMQLLLDSGMDPNAASLNVPVAPLSLAPPSILPRQEAQTLPMSSFAPVKPLQAPRPTTPPAPMTPNNARVGTGDDNYPDLRFDDRIAAAAEAYGVDPDIARGLFDVENMQRDPYATNKHSTAIGLGQLVEASRADYNKAHGTNFTREDFFDPDLNMDATFWYLTTRDGKTIQDQLRAYNQGNGGMRRGLGGDYLNKVLAAAGQPPAPMTDSEGLTVAAASQAYDDEEVIPPLPEQVLLPAEAAGGAEPEKLRRAGYAGEIDEDVLANSIVDTTKDSPGFMSKLMGALSGPLGEGLIGMGAGILGARGTYGDTWQAIGQGGQQGLEAYGYAQRRAQRDREAAAAAKVEQQKLLSEAEARRFTRTNMKMQTFNSMADKYGPKAMVAYLKANPDLLEQFGGEVSESMFESKNGWQTHISGGHMIRTNKSGEVEVTKLPEGVTVAGTAEVEGPGGKPIRITYDKQGNRVSELGAVPPKSSSKSQRIIDARPADDPTSGITVKHIVNEDGTLTPMRDAKGGYVYGEQGRTPFMRGADGKMQLSQEDNRTDAGKTRLYEDMERARSVYPTVTGLIGERNSDGEYVGGSLTDDVVGIARDIHLQKVGLEAQSGAIKRIFSVGARKEMPAEGEDDSKRFTHDKWFNRLKVSESDYMLSSLAYQLAIASNPDGRISDADMAFARERLGGAKWALSSAQDIRARVAAFAKEIYERGANAYISLKKESELPESLRPYYLAIDNKALSPDQIARRDQLIQQWGEAEAAQGPTPKEPPAKSTSAAATTGVRARLKVDVPGKGKKGDEFMLPPGQKIPADSKVWEAVE